MNNENSPSRLSIRSWVFMVIAIILLVVIVTQSKKTLPQQGQSESVSLDQVDELGSEYLNASQLEINSLANTSDSLDLNDIEAEMSFDFDTSTRLDELE